MPNDDELEPPADFAEWRFRLVANEREVRALGPAVGQVAALGASLEGVTDDVRELRETHRAHRVETRQGLERNRDECRDGLKALENAVNARFDKLRDDLRDDRRESRNRTALALGPIALAALALFAKVVLGVDIGPTP